MIFIFGGAYSGKEDFAKRELGADKKIIRDLHLFIKDAMQNGKNPYDETERLLEENKDAVFITNEVGCGIVPLDAFKREWREVCGRISCFFAEKADEVYRVVCGIGIKVK